MSPVFPSSFLFILIYAEADGFVFIFMSPMHFAALSGVFFLCQLSPGAFYEAVT